MEPLLPYANGEDEKTHDENGDGDHNHDNGDHNHDYDGDDYGSNDLEYQMCYCKHGVPSFPTDLMKRLMMLMLTMKMIKMTMMLMTIKMMMMMMMMMMIMMIMMKKWILKSYCCGIEPSLTHGYVS